MSRLSQKPSHYEWLIIVEGPNDAGTYKYYLYTDGEPKVCHIEHVGGGNSAKNMSTWNPKLIMALNNNLARKGFKGVILVIDSDENSSNPFRDYKRNETVRYNEYKPIPRRDASGDFWHIDEFDKAESGNNIFLRGVSAPSTASGALETELLSAYRFPIEGQNEYCSLTNIIKRATTEWNIPKNGDGKHWWEANETAKMDKFIYSALRNGFITVDKKPILPTAPDVITRIQKAMNM